MLPHLNGRNGTPISEYNHVVLYGDSSMQGSLDIGTKIVVWDTFRKTAVLSEIQEVQQTRNGKNARLTAPYDERMGWFSLDALTRSGKTYSKGIGAYLPERWECCKAEVLNKMETPSTNPDDQKNRELLGIPNSSLLSEKLVRDAAKSKAKQVHPDVGGTDAKMQAVNEAREVLVAKAKENKRANAVWGSGY